jgi:hypothetical protein
MLPFGPDPKPLAALRAQVATSHRTLSNVGFLNDATVELD